MRNLSPVRETRNTGLEKFHTNDVALQKSMSLIGLCLVLNVISHNFPSPVASWLVRSSPDRAVRVRALARDIALCSWTRHFTLTVSLFTQVYK